MIRQRLLAAAVALLLAVHVGLLAYSATRHSPTMLEPALLAAGLSHWEFGRFELYRVNPPLVRMVAALPVMAAGYESDWSGFYESPGARPEFSMGSDFVAANGERSIWLFTIARWACIPFSLIGGLFAFQFSRELWRSDLAGLLTLAVWCFEPNILAHAELITNDVGCTAFGLGATWLFWRWLKDPGWGRAALAGVALGFAQLSKSSWLILFGLWPLLAAIWWLAGGRRRSPENVVDASRGESIATASALKPPGETRSRADVLPQTFLASAGQLGLVLLLGVYVLNLGYAFDGTFTRLGEFDFVSRSLTGLEEPGEAGNRFRGTWLGEVPVPLPRQYVLGIDIQKEDFESWRRPSYLRGEWKQGGWWYYYLYGMWVKVPHGVQLLVLMAVLYPLWRWVASRSRGAVPPAPARGAFPPAIAAGRNDSPLHDRIASPQAANGRMSPLDVLVMLVPGLALFVLVSSQTAMNEHFRYVLPTIGTLTVLIGQAAFYAFAPVND